MSRSRSHTFTVTVRVVLRLPDVSEALGPVLTEHNLADPDLNVDAAMDDRLLVTPVRKPCARRNDALLGYIVWLLDEALARHPSWAGDELQRALRRLVEVQIAAKTACQKLH